ncbi:MAG: HAD family hydrolase [Pseudobdellovibrio sp.]
MKKYALLFDCDGTLVDSLGAGIESFNYSLSLIGEKPRAEEEIKRFFGASADRIFFGLLQDEKKALAAFENYMNHQTQLSLNMKLHTGIRHLLETSAAAHIPMGVVTGRHERDMHVVLRPHKISDYFQTMVADSHLKESKPAPEGILLAVKNLGVEPQNVCYVGDSVMDIQAAHAAGCSAIAALWDRHVKLDDMLAQKPELMANKPSDVWNFFRRFSA